MIMVAENTEGGQEVRTYDNLEEALEGENRGQYWTERDTENLKAFAENTVMGDFAKFSKGYFIRVSSKVQVSQGEFGIVF